MVMIVVHMDLLRCGLRLWLLPRLAPEQSPDAIGKQIAQPGQGLAQQASDAAENSADNRRCRLVQPEEAELAGEHEIEPIGDDHQNHHIIEISR